MNQRRCCANDSGSGRSRGTGTTGESPAASAAAPSTHSATPATVGRSKSARSGSSTPNASRSCVTTRVARSECPPISKKSSCTPTRGAPSTAAKIAASRSSTAVRGATCSRASAHASGAGSALRSTLPLPVRGSAARGTKAEGSMYSGRCARRCARSSAASIPSAAGTTYAARRFSPASSLATTTASATDGCARNALSISPGSMRKPRTLTWKSVRPKYSSSPAAVQRTRSITRYIRAPGAPNGSGRKRSAVSSGRPA